MSVLREKIEAAGASGRKALIPYLPFGFPTRERFWAEVEGMDRAGADVIEIGVPFSDPVADGPVIERAVLQCLECGASLAGLLADLKERELSAGIVLMGYMNPFYQYGFERLAKDAAEAGVHGFIIPDLPLEEAEETRNILDKHGLDLVPLIGLNTTPERMQAYAEHARGFVYMVSVMGTTGAREDLPPQVEAKLRQAKESFEAPLALGFGITGPSQVAHLGDLVDAVVFGSGLVRYVEEGDEPGRAAEFLRRFI
ncbi:tryptophan synthase subunit alpha [Desulfohalovibrio reitneri]|uniref:tryptophan synthase subunit alpha n=1 Tax=Desulfohalovibrio reitneri TaxID=1307759 RepID=UPI0004A6BBED|nr:tryptophan synthase subunit alpha [Desulfohalovibrio reitneri]